MVTITDSARQAASALAADQLVALPTETVYGLGGLATSRAAVERIFAVKGRPVDHPVIVHIDGVSSLAHWTASVSPAALALAEAFWPGPLTIVCPRADAVLDQVTGGQPTVALRAPSHPLFVNVLAELSALGIEHPGIAAPSANRFGSVSPTTAQHVIDGLGEYLAAGDLVLDGGPAAVGVESTIVICTDHTARIARAGGITAEQIAGVVALESVAAESVRVPGALASHYSPQARVILLDGVSDLAEIADQIADADRIGLLGLARDLDTVGLDWIQLARPHNSAEYAHDLYAALRTADEIGVSKVIAILPPDEGIGSAVRDRLIRAAH